MLSRYRVSRAAIELIKRFEGYRRKAVQLPDGRWTIGYGHTLTAREGAEVSEPDAEALLIYDLIAVQHAVNEQVYAPLTQNQFNALCSFAFNVGLDNFRRSQVLKRLNAGAMVQAACAMELWRKADFEGERIVVDALVRRRAAEKALFLTPEGDAWVAAPSPLLRPVIDLDALDLVPLRRPVEVETFVEGDRLQARRDDIAEPEPDLAPELAPGPQPAVTIAAEAIAARLETLFQEPGEAPDLEAVPAPVEDEAAHPAEPTEDPRPQADFAPPISPAAAVEPAPAPEHAEGTEAAFAAAEFDAEPATDAELDIPEAPADEPVGPELEGAYEPVDFFRERDVLPPPRQAPSVIWDLLLALFGLAFFGFGVFWGLNARPEPSMSLVSPVMVAWLAGLAGVGFVSVAVFHLLQRLGREAEAD